MTDAMDDRPRCCNCRKLLNANHQGIWTRVETHEGFSSKLEKGELIGYGYGSQNLFCTLRCGYMYAVSRITGHHQQVP